jgi:catechol 2,3-dioxygenase-like lactoylglutathione lyase family enzyme
MTKPQLDLIGVVVEDMARSLAFYRQLGLDLPADADAQPHVEIALPGGTRLAWDTVATIQSFLPDFEPTAARASVWRSGWRPRPRSTPRTRSWWWPATTGTRRRGMHSGASGTP